MNDPEQPPMSSMLRYRISKLATMFHADYIQNLLGAAGAKSSSSWKTIRVIDAATVHPGILFFSCSKMFPAVVASLAMSRLTTYVMMKTAEEGATTSVTAVINHASGALRPDRSAKATGGDAGRSGGSGIPKSSTPLWQPTLYLADCMPSERECALAYDMVLAKKVMEWAVKQVAIAK